MPQASIAIAKTKRKYPKGCRLEKALIIDSIKGDGQGIATLL